MSRLIASSAPKETQENYLFSEGGEKQNKGIPIEDIRGMLGELIEQERLSNVVEKTVIEEVKNEPIEIETVVVANQEPPVQVEAVVAEIPRSESFELNGVEAFVNWLNENRTKFTEGQLAAFSAIEGARAVIYQGCNCQEGRRRNRANDYFKVFFDSNKETDILSSIKRAANTDLLILKNHHGEFARL